MKRLTAIAASAAFLLAAAPALAAAPDDIVRAPLTDPYLLGDRNTRMVFPDSVTVETWGSPAAKEVAAPSLSQWLLSGAVTVREGSRLVKFGTDPQVYAVGPQGRLHWIKDEGIAAALYGKDWDARVVTLFSSFYPLYRIGAPIETARHPDGTLIKYAGSPTVYYLVNGYARPFATERAFRDNRFSFDSVVTVPSSYAYAKGSAIVGMEAGLRQVGSGS